MGEDRTMKGEGNSEEAEVARETKDKQKKQKKK